MSQPMPLPDSGRAGTTPGAAAKDLVYSDRPLIPDHELLKRIGAGAYGEVWLARSVTGAFRAAKVVYRRRFEDERPFEREFKGIQKFEPVSRLHTSQLAVLHVGRNDGCFYYIMELADDANAEIRNPKSEIRNWEAYVPRTLQHDLQQRGRLPPDECLRLALSLTTALEHLHQHGLIHRDIKPSNIIFVGGIPKLADIGLVAGVDATLSFVGTEGFVPPEGPGTAQADLYSLGKVFYEICTGRDRQEYPELPTGLRENTDREALVELNEIILKACEADPRKRYHAAEEMHADLALLQAGKSVRRAHGLEKRLAAVKRFALAAAAVALLAVGVIYQAKRAERLAVEQVHRLQIAQGVHLLNEGDLYGSALWFAQALNLGLEDATQAEINRLRIGTALGASPQLRQIVFHQDMVRRAVFSPDGRRIATASDDRTARVWDAVTGEPVTPPLKHDGEVWDVEFSPDGHWLVTASDDHTARVWDLSAGQAGATTGAPLSPPLRHSGRVYRATFHPNGSLVATASEDHTAQIWNARTGEPVGLPMQHEDRIQCVRFSPDGEWVATASRDGTARIWRTPEPVRMASTAALSVGSTGDPPVPSGDPPDGMVGGLKHDLAFFRPQSPFSVPLGESPSGAGGPPNVTKI